MSEKKCDTQNVTSTRESGEAVTTGKDCVVSVESGIKLASWLTLSNLTAGDFEGYVKIVERSKER